MQPNQPLPFSTLGLIAHYQQDTAVLERLVKRVQAAPTGYAATDAARWQDSLARSRATLAKLQTLHELEQIL